MKLIPLCLQSFKELQTEQVPFKDLKFSRKIKAQSTAHDCRRGSFQLNTCINLSGQNLVGFKVPAHSLLLCILPFLFSNSHLLSLTNFLRLEEYEWLSTKVKFQSEAQTVILTETK